MSFATMKSTVAQRARVAASGWNTTVIGTYINECIQGLVKMPVDWKVLEKQDTVDMVSGQANYALPSDWERTLAINLENSPNYYKLVENNWDVVRSILNSETSNDLPRFYCIHYQQIYFAPAPDTTYTIRHDFIYAPTDLSSDGDTTPFPEKLVMQYALAYFKKDLGRHAEFDKEYQLYEIELNRFREGQDRGPDRMDGFAMGVNLTSPYYSEAAQHGNSTVVKSLRDL